MNIKFITTSQFAGSTVTSSSEAAGFPDTNTLILPIKKQWRSVVNTVSWLKYDLGSAKDVDSFLLSFHNFSDSAVLKLYGHSSNLGNAEADWIAGATFKTDNTLSIDRSVAALFLPSTQTLQWWFLSITDSGNTDGYFQVGYVFGGLSVSPTENFNENLEVSWLDPSLIQDSDGQNRFTVEKERYKSFSVTFTDFDNSNQSLIETIWQTVYKTQPFFLGLDAVNETASWSRIVQFDSDLSWGYGPNDRATTNLIFKEIR